MEQKDFILREIEKIGLMLRMIFDKISRKQEHETPTTEDRLQEAKGLLLHEVGFDVDLCFSLEISEIEQYISTLNGISGPNIELLADVLKVMGIRSDSAMTTDYLERALKLYEVCNSLDKTFSFDREGKIKEIKNIL